MATKDNEGLPAGRIHPSFTVHMLNEQGIQKATDLAHAFTKLADFIEDMLPEPGRERSQAIASLELASYHAKRGMAMRKENQKP